MSQTLNSTNVVRELQRIQHIFPDLRGDEDLWFTGFVCLDEQIAWAVRKNTIHDDDQVLQSLAAAGLQAYDQLESHPLRSWDDLTDGVRQLAQRLVGTFDPSANEEMRGVAETAWTGAGDRVFHFRQSGAIVCRLMDSVQQHKKRDPRGYCRFVTSFVKKLKSGGGADHINWTVWSQTAPDRAAALISDRNRS